MGIGGGIHPDDGQGTGRWGAKGDLNFEEDRGVGPGAEVRVGFGPWR
jgi:hypothetical protein